MNVMQILAWIIMGLLVGISEILRTNKDILGKRVFYLNDLPMLFVYIIVGPAGLLYYVLDVFFKMINSYIGEGEKIIWRE